eukprot:2598016-Amphidinium_carterae.2
MSMRQVTIERLVCGGMVSGGFVDEFVVAGRGADLFICFQELIYEEAKKLEELRAKRLKDACAPQDMAWTSCSLAEDGGGEDILASLIGAAEVET